MLRLRMSTAASTGMPDLACHTRVAQSINTTITGHLATLGQQNDCPSLHWSVDLNRPGTVTGHAADYDEHETGDVLTAWSHLLGLTWQNSTAPGTWRFAGQVGVLLVDIWGVTDRATFNTLHRLADDATDRKGFV